MTLTYPCRATRISACVLVCPSKQIQYLPNAPLLRHPWKVTGQFAKNFSPNDLELQCEDIMYSRQNLLVHDISVIIFSGKATSGLVICFQVIHCQWKIPVPKSMPVQMGLVEHGGRLSKFHSTLPKQLFLVEMFWHISIKSQSMKQMLLVYIRIIVVIFSYKYHLKMQEFQRLAEDCHYEFPGGEEYKSWEAQ